MKVCSMCGEEKPQYEYCKNTASKDGLRPECKQCRSAINKEWVPQFISKVCNTCGADKAAIEYAPRRAKCNSCKAEVARKHQITPEAKAKQRVYGQARWEEKRSQLSAVNKVWRSKNTERMKQNTYAWRKENKEAYHAINARSRKKHHDRVMVDNGKRRATELRATPSWANKDAMRAFYKTASGLNMLFGEWHHVDHIVPLKSKLVCGLHCEVNLRVTTAMENVTKNNLFWPDMPVKER